MTPELRFATIISIDGITLYHQDFINDEMDEYLFSGFSSAMIAFSKELGDELTAIKMENQTIMYRDLGEGVLILSFNNGYDESHLAELINEVVYSDPVDLILEGSKMGFTQNTNKMMESVLKNTFRVLGTDKEDETEILKEEENEEDIFMEALEGLTSLD